MNPVSAEVAFLGQVFLKENAAELRSLAQELALADWEQALDENTGRLDLEFNRLFLNPLGAPCLPWQSAHGDEPRLMGEAHLSALAWYRRFGVEPAAAHEPADHLGLLLLFYAHLLDSEAPPETIEQFRAQHLDWAPRFCDDVTQQTALAFYRAVSAGVQRVLGAS